GDILVFSFPLGTTGRAVKRVVAIGGDAVTVAADAISVNGQTIAIAGADGIPGGDARRETGHRHRGDATSDSMAVRRQGEFPRRGRPTKSRAKRSPLLISGRPTTLQTPACSTR